MYYLPSQYVFRIKFELVFSLLSKTILSKTFKEIGHFDKQSIYVCMHYIHCKYLEDNHYIYIYLHITCVLREL